MGRRGVRLGNGRRVGVGVGVGVGRRGVAGGVQGRCRGGVGRRGV